MTIQAALDALALAFVVRTEGRWTQSARDAFARRVSEELPSLAPGVVDQALAQAKLRYAEGSAHLFVCAGEACASEGAEACARFAGILGVGFPCSPTACQGPCERAAVATLRVGARCEMFATLASAEDHRDLAQLAHRALTANTLLLDFGAARRLRFDPVHACETGPDPLEPLAFLVGHFAGEGVQGTEGAWFHKEWLGSREVGGRALLLRMAVTYAMEDGRKDRHEAFVVLGRDPATSRLTARSYDDSGGVREHAIEVAPGAIGFADAVRRHGAVPLPARKWIEASPDGLVERVELVPSEGPPAPYSYLQLRRID